MRNFSPSPLRKFLYERVQKMKKSNLWVGLSYLAAGAAFLVLALILPGKLTRLFEALASVGVISGVICLGHYFYWIHPKNRLRYQAKTAQEQIELGDERKVMLRDRAGRYAYIAGLAVVFVLLVVFYILDLLQVLEGRLIIFSLFGYLVFQYLIGIVIFRHLGKKY